MHQPGDGDDYSRQWGSIRCMIGEAGCRCASGDFFMPCFGLTLAMAQSPLRQVITTLYEPVRGSETQRARTAACLHTSEIRLVMLGLVERNVGAITQMLATAMAAFKMAPVLEGKNFV